MANKLSNKIKRISAKGAILLGMSMLLASSVYGCAEEPEAVPNEEYDMIDPSGSIVDDEGDLLFDTGVTKELPIKGETFKLVVTFSYDYAKTRSWNITTDKFLNYAVNTDGLPAGYEVYVDNVHIDAFVKANNYQLDGIRQDTMDDRIHNALMYGFPISDSAVYYGIDLIEGMNQEFIDISYYGFYYNSYYYGGSSVEKRRYTESDYMDYGAYGNKIATVIDLLIKGPNDKDFRAVSVSTDFVIFASNERAILNYKKLSTSGN